MATITPKYKPMNRDWYGQIFATIFLISIVSILIFALSFILWTEILIAHPTILIIWLVLSMFGFFVSPVIVITKSNDKDLKKSIAGVFR